MVTGRLAPTPSGDLHVGNLTAFLAAWLSARTAGGRVLLRIEDVDTARARADVAARQRADLRWLGLDWDEEVPSQSARDYAPFLHALHASTYFCTCTRKDVAAAGGVYPGTCREAGHPEGKVRLRLPDGPVTFLDRRWGARTVDPATQGDPVLRRADGVFTYDLAVVADDLVDGVTEVVRGADLLEHTAVQVRLWEALGATPPTWLHTPLVLGSDGRKLSKSHGAQHVCALRDAGIGPEQVLARVFPWLGLRAATLQEALAAWDPTAGPRGPVTAD